MAFLKQLAETCDFKAFLDEALRDQLVCNLKSEAIQKCLLTEAELDLKKALEISHGSCHKTNHGTTRSNTC